MLALSVLSNYNAKPLAFSGAEAVDRAINDAITAGQLPGAVLVVGHNGKIVYKKAYGERAVEPVREPMTLDTIFDCASLTKVIATTASLMKLYEEGRFRLNDKLTDYIPEFQGGKSDITLRNLFTHFSGLKPDVLLKPEWRGYAKGVELACTFAPGGPPGVAHVYSDINFILLGEFVHRLSGKLVSDYSQENVFKPLGMNDSMFTPPASLLPRIAPTERDPATGVPFRGVVHDPTARNMDGVAGHAGLFSTGEDLAKFAQTMLNQGKLGRTRLFNPLTVQKFTEPQTPTDQPILRGLGWDIDSPYSSNRGELFPIGSYGHTGFTGTSIWIDPTSQTYVILLANAIHPTSRPPLISLRARVSTIVAASFGVASGKVELNGYNEAGTARRHSAYHVPATLTGLDVLEQDRFAALQGKRIGLVTNPTGRDRWGTRNVDAMLKAGVNVVALFSPEHGWASEADHPGIADTRDPATGIKVFSLYGQNLRPTAEMLRGIDALVFDIQDVGVRFYTYETTMAYCLEEAAKAHVPFIVLDRPNPINAVFVEGPPLDPNNVSFVGYFPGMPVRHGMTMGELATLYNGENHLAANLSVVKMRGYNRGDWFDASGLTWVNPSPNMRSLNAATLYPGLCLLEALDNLSVGRGTDAPFEQIGAENIDTKALAAYVNAERIPGLAVYPTAFTPTESKLAGKLVQGVRFVITDREALEPTRLGIALAAGLKALNPGRFDFTRALHLIGSRNVIELIKAGEPAANIVESYRDAVEAFRRLRAKYLLY